MRLFLLLSLIFNSVVCLNFVVYLNVIGKSHVNFVAALVDLLVARGHNVDLLEAKLNTAVDTDGATNARKVMSFQFPGDSPWMKAKHLVDPFQHTQPFDMGNFYRVNTELCRVGLESGEPLKFLKEGNYDAILVAQYEYCGLIFAKAAGISSVIGYTATNMMPTQAISTGLFNSPNCVTGNMDSDEGSFDLWSRISRFYYWNKFYWFTRNEGQAAQTALAREFFGNEFPEVEELERNLDLVLINTNEIIEIPRTISHKVIYIGGVALNAPKPLNNEFSKLLSNSSRGNIVISFGTQVPSKIIPRRVKEAIVYAAQKLNEFTFIFKYELQEEDDFLFDNATNLHLLKWIPQTDMLSGHIMNYQKMVLDTFGAHWLGMNQTTFGYNIPMQSQFECDLTKNDGRISAFVSHMGLNSLLETTSAGVPLVSIPLFADQGHNARCAARLGMGVILKKATFTGVELADALSKVVTDESFKINAIEVSRLLSNKPDDMKKRFVDWTEFIAKHKDVHKVLNLPENDTNFFIYYCLDLVFYFTAAVILGLYLSYKTLMVLKHVS